MTIQELYNFARELKLEDAELRICDGMAVSYYPTRPCLGYAPFEVVLDVSSIEPIDYDDLKEHATRVVYPYI